MRNIEEEVSRIITIESGVKGKLYYDLTDDCIIENDTEYVIDEKGRPVEKYTQIVRAVSKQIPDTKEQQSFKQLFERENLIELFDKGQANFKFEYRRNLFGEKAVWVRTNVNMFKNSSTEHIIAFLYTKDINDKKQTIEIVEAITSAVYEYIMLVDVEGGGYKLFSHSDKHIMYMPESGDNYWEDLKDSLEGMMPEDEYEKLLESRNKENILEVLEKNSKAEFISEIIDKDNRVLVKQIRYAYLNDIKTQLIVTCTDITDVMEKEKRQNALLESALIAATQANTAKSEFLSRMSHEIRTPMNAMLGMTALATQAIGNDEEVLSCLSKIGISGHYLLSIINDILDMSRIESGKMLLHNESFEFEAFIEDINTMIYSQIEDKGINYETIITHGIRERYIGDAMKLQQILINLLGNAVKFTPRGGKITFSITATESMYKKTELRFAINDTGCGIEEDAIDRIFNVFEQQDNTTTSTYGGSGLGLAISKNLAELMGGNIKVRSIVGIGSEFVVSIPLEVDDKEQSPIQQNISFANLHTLIVDDDLIVCEQTAATLKEMGMIAEWVTSGREAVDKVTKWWEARKSYDFILIDWKMPEMDGIETARRIRKIVGPDVTIIIITAYDWTSIEQKAKAAGVNMCITKPMFKRTLISAFTKATGEAEKERNNPTKQEFDFTGKRVLVAEDHPLNAEIVKKLLENKNCKVDVVNNGIRALEQFTSTPVNYYEAILMDIRMPIMDGLQATTNIRHWNKEDAKTIPIIAMTANAFDEDIEKSKMAGMDAHLAKPIDPQLMYHTINRLIK